MASNTKSLKNLTKQQLIQVGGLICCDTYKYSVLDFRKEVVSGIDLIYYVFTKEIDVDKLIDFLNHNGGCVAATKLEEFLNEDNFNEINEYEKEIYENNEYKPLRELNNKDKKDLCDEIIPYIIQNFNIFYGIDYHNQIKSSVELIEYAIKDEKDKNGSKKLIYFLENNRGCGCLKILKERLKK